jgi:hypothetical protein
VAYPREFGIEDFLTLFQEMDAARNSLTSETAIKEQEKKLIRKLFARDSMKLRKKMEREIDGAEGKMPAVRMPFGPMGPIPPGLNKGEPGPVHQGEPGGASVSGEPGGSPPHQPDAGMATAA